MQLPCELIPKVEQPEDVTQLRSMACYNVLCKVISNMIGKGLKIVLPCIVEQVQSAFVENRIIVHNILICQDILKHYKRNSQPDRCTMRIDLRKAHDLVHWAF